MLRLAVNDPGSRRPRSEALCGTSRPAMGREGMVWGKRQPSRSCTLIATVFRYPGFSPARSAPVLAAGASACLSASVSDNSRSHKHLNGFSNGGKHSNSKRLESRACENCHGNLEDELLYNRRISCVRPRKNRKRVSAAIEETSHKHWRKAGYGSGRVPASSLCRLCAATAQ